jgi:hypothetical protein
MAVILSGVKDSKNHYGIQADDVKGAVGKASGKEAMDFGISA